MERELKVTPQKLEQTADEFSNVGTTVSNLTQEMLDLVAGMSSVWEGDASAAYLNKFAALRDDMEQIRSNLIEAEATAMREIAAEYSATEQANNEAASGMNTDWI